MNPGSLMLTVLLLSMTLDLRLLTLELKVILKVTYFSLMLLLTILVSLHLTLLTSDFKLEVILVQILAALIP